MCADTRLVGYGQNRASNLTALGEHATLLPAAVANGR